MNLVEMIEVPNNSRTPVEVILEDTYLRELQQVTDIPEGARLFLPPGGSVFFPALPVDGLKLHYYPVQRDKKGARYIYVGYIDEEH